MAQRLMTMWWQTSGSPDQLGRWLDRYLLPVSGFTIRRYHVEGATHELLSWIEDAGDFGDLSNIVSVLSNAPASNESFTFDLVRDVGMASTPLTPWLYIVHTDIPAEIVADYNAWYDEEHLPRLVTVPGVVRARRYVANDGVSPRYLTAYDLSIRDAFESPEGLKARKTPWTEKMRSLFQNTRRKMCALAT
ncbi:MAG: hypothetical protein QOD29_475 [Alphaproteobacteria bacterium]|jgi:hypothetical protein|nr:hypothetical protein [Alphaproteobacteria bacterium]